MGAGSVTGKLFEEALALEIGASRGQVLGDQDEVIPPGRLPLTGNFVDRDEIHIFPRLETRLGKSTTLGAGYRYSKGSYDNPQFQDDAVHHATFSLDNYAAGSGLAWALRYDGRRTQYEVSRDWAYQRASAELGFWANEKLRVFGSGGKESSWDDPFNADMEDPFWEAGFAYTRGESLYTEFAAGERGFGSSWRGTLEYSFSRGSTSLNYSQTPSSTAFNQSQSGGPRDNPDDIDEFLDEPGQAQHYLLKRLDWSLNIDIRRTSFGLVLFDEDRLGRTSADGTPLGDQAQRGVRASLSWKAGVRTEFVLSGSLVRREINTTNRSKYRHAGLAVNYELGHRTQLTLDYAFDEQEPLDTDSTSRDYESNVVSFFFTFTM